MPWRGDVASEVSRWSPRRAFRVMERHLRHTGGMVLDHFDLPTIFVDTPEKLQAALPLWHAAGVLAVDIE